MEEELRARWGGVSARSAADAAWTRPDPFPRDRPVAAGGWWDGFASPLPNGHVASAVVFGDRVILAGSFTHIGVQSLPGIAAWDGARYERFSSAERTSFDRLVVHHGTLYASAFNALLRWTGSAWESTGGAADPNFGYPDHFVSDGSRLLASGTFYDQGSRLGVKLYESGTWRLLPGRVEGHISAITLWNGEPWIAGAIWIDGGFTPIARHDGEAWRSVVPPSPTFSGYIADLDVWNDTVIAAGSFDSLGGVYARGVARWNGNAFEPVGSLPPCGIYTVLVEGNQIQAWGWIMGDDEWFGSARLTWDGAAWNELRLDGDLLVEDAFRFRDVVHAIGEVRRVDDIAYGLVRERQPSTWEGTVAPSPSLHGIVRGAVEDFEVWNGALWAGGSFGYVADNGSWQRSDGVAVWDGTGWSTTSAPEHSVVRDLLVHEGSLYAGGTFWNSERGLMGVMRRSGEGWVYAAPHRNDLQHIAVYRGEILAFGSPHSEPTSAAVLRDGAWIEIGQAGPASSTQSGFIYYAVDVVDDRVYVAGTFDRVGDLPAYGLARWDGVRWEPLTGLPQGEPRGMRVIGGTLVVAGRYRDPRGGPLALFRYAAHGVTPLAAGEAHEVSTMSGGMVAYGQFRIGPDEGHVLYGSPSSWRVAPGYVIGGVHAIGSYRGSVYLGGLIFGIQDPNDGSRTPASNVARFDPPALRWRPMGSGVLQARSSSSALPSFTLDLDRGGPARLDVHDVAGRRIDAVLDRTLDAGAHDVTWNARGVAPGVYFARLRHAGGEASARFVVLPSP